jgi:hypothetical protein
MAIGEEAWLREVVTGAVPAEHHESLWALKRPALRIVPGAAVDPRAPGSRLGGWPLGAAGARWPVSEDGPLNLLAQLDLAEVARIWPAGPLPDRGLLSFFYDTEEPPWTFTSPDPDRWRVCWEPDEVEPLPAPEGRHTYPSRSIRWEPAMTLPRPTEDDGVFQSLDYSLSRALSAVDDAVGRGPAFHQLLGWPHLLQGSMTTTCQRESAFARQGLERYDPDRILTEEDWDELNDATRASDWRLLLQLGSDASGDWCWGDGGGLYFWIRAEDLAAARFNQAWTVMQS